MASSARPIPSKPAIWRRGALVAGAAIALAGTAAAQSPGPRVQIAPGGSANLVIPVHNRATGSAMIELRGHYFGPPQVISEYQFGLAGDARCGRPQLGAGNSRIVVGPLAAGEVLECTWPVTRHASSRNDLTFGVCANLDFPSACDHEAMIGSLPDMTLATRQLTIAQAGDTEVLVRVSARNASNVATAPRRFHTECAAYGASEGQPRAPYDISNDFPGACAGAPFLAGCMAFLGQHTERREFTIGAVPAGGEASCLLKLQLHEPLATPVGLDLYFEDFTVPLADGGTGHDPSASNGITRLAATLGGSPDARLPIGGAAGVSIVGLLALAGAWRLRRRPTVR
jgi:hypothetical protein